jgi:putative hydrolase of the HAD superfamily
VDRALVEGLRLLSLDAGNTVVFLDHARLAALATREGFPVDTGVLLRAEGAAKHAHAKGALIDVPWSCKSAPGAAGWGRMVGTILTVAGLAPARLPALLDPIWRAHVDLNLWSLVPDGLGPALDRVRAAGIPVVLVSNSEGMLEPLFRRLGIHDHFDMLLDSGKIGLEKPDPRIFQLATDRFGVDPTCALHLGDLYGTDVLGARAARMRAALIDPAGHLEGSYPEVPRVPGVVAVADAILSTRQRAHPEGANAGRRGGPVP